MNVAEKLELDFLFYLSFFKTCNDVANNCDRNQIKRWLHQLCSVTNDTVEQKRNRNIFFSNFLSGLEDNKRAGPLLQKPGDVSFNETNKKGPRKEDARTHRRTRAFPEKKSAVAYVATNEERKRCQKQSKQFVPPPNAIEVILARTKDPKERQRVITFYEAIMTNISDELDGTIRAKENPDITFLLNQLAANLRRSGQFQVFKVMSEWQRRFELLHLLHDKTAKRRRQTLERKEVLDAVGPHLPPEIGQYSTKSSPNRQNIEKIREANQSMIVAKFHEILATAKEDIAKSIARRLNPDKC